MLEAAGLDRQHRREQARHPVDPIGAAHECIASGAGKRRMAADESLKAGYTWSTFLIMSSERGLEERIRSDGGAWTAGSSVRMADIDVSDVNNLAAEVVEVESGKRKDHPKLVQALTLCRLLQRDADHREARSPV
jgi:hypothetical protein